MHTAPPPPSGCTVRCKERRASARRGEVAVRLLAAGLLFLGAGFKVYALFSGLTIAEAWVTAPPALFAVALAELALGLLLLSQWQARLILSVAAIVFGLFAALNGWAGLQGRASCGCFGTLSISPWPMAVLDLAVAIALVACARHAAAAPSQTPVIKRLAVALGSVVLLVGLGYGTLRAVGIHPETLLARLRGDLISVSPGEVDLGAGQAGERVETTVTLHNHAEQPIRIVGGSDDCSCITTADLPLQLEPGATATIRLKVRRMGSPGVQRRKYLLYTDHPQQPRVYAQLVGRVASTGSSQ